MSSSFSGTQGDDTIASIRNRDGDNYGDGATILNPESSQIHLWANAGADHITLGFDSIATYTKGHHARGDDRAFTGGLFADVFVFTALDEVTQDAVVVGRIEDYDPTRDEIFLGETRLALDRGQGTVDGVDWKVVLWDGNPLDSVLGTQYYLVLQTGNGTVFYALEGARVAMDGMGGGEGNQEDHFVKEWNLPLDFALLEPVAFVDPQNHVPADAVAQGGITINDYDDDAANVLAVITGSAGGDLIAAGLNDDVVEAGAGNDQIWGGSGQDTLRGGDGDDTLVGGPGADVIEGGPGFDTVSYANAPGRVLVDLMHDVSVAPFAGFYDAGASEGDIFDGVENVIAGRSADMLRGDNAANVLWGGYGADRIYGRRGADTLDGGMGRDVLYGNSGADVMTGGEGLTERDRFVYFSEMDSGVGAGNRDVITDFQTGIDRIEIGRLDANTTMPLQQDFDFIADAEFSGTAGELGYRFENGATIVQADFDGDSLPDFEIELTGTIALDVNDFLI
ncbi:MAG: calcium-binding protein [Roseovarius sp.]